MDGSSPPPMSPPPDGLRMHTPLPFWEGACATTKPTAMPSYRLMRLSRRGYARRTRFLCTRWRRGGGCVHAQPIRGGRHGGGLLPSINPSQQLPLHRLLTQHLRHQQPVRHHQSADVCNAAEEGPTMTVTGACPTGVVFEGNPPAQPIPFETVQRECCMCVGSEHRNCQYFPQKSIFCSKSLPKSPFSLHKLVGKTPFFGTPKKIAP